MTYKRLKIFFKFFLIPKPKMDLHNKVCFVLLEHVNAFCFNFPLPVNIVLYFIYQLSNVFRLSFCLPLQCNWPFVPHNYNHYIRHLN